MSNKTLVFIIGAPAVGKMTVGKALAARTGFPLLHNHMSIEVALRFFDFGTDGFNAISGTIRRTVFDTVATSDLAGLIFTVVWAFELEEEEQYFRMWIDRWKELTGGDVLFLELRASEEAKRERNRHADRLAEKPSKRDVARSEAQRRRHEHEHRFTSAGGFPLDAPHLVIDNTELTPEAVADAFYVKFGALLDQV